MLGFLGGIFLVVGLLTPLVGMFFVVEFGSVSMMRLKMRAKFISTEQGKPTHEIDVLNLLLGLVFLVLGAGPYSLDWLLGL